MQTMKKYIVISNSIVYSDVPYTVQPRSAISKVADSKAKNSQVRFDLESNLTLLDAKIDRVYERPSYFWVENSAPLMFRHRNLLELDVTLHRLVRNYSD